MKLILTFWIILTALSCFGQKMTLRQWEQESWTNSRLLPKYGNRIKTEDEKEADEKFIYKTMQQSQYGGDRTKASKHMVRLGFDYLSYGDVKTAMYRFNQAYLLDSLNDEIFRGYGAVYMALEDYQRARDQYVEGLAINPGNAALLSDLGGYHIRKFSDFQVLNERKANPHLDSALYHIDRSYSLNSQSEDTTYRLSVCYWFMDDCLNARRYYNECKKLGGRPITEQFTNDINIKCN